MKNRKNIIIVVAVVAVIAVVAAGVLFFRQSRNNGSAWSPELDSNAVALASDTEEPPTGIRIPGYPKITIPADTAEVTMNLKNPEGNPCYFTFTLVLTDNEETIYTSKMVEPGKAITKVNLTRALSAGEYPAELRITTASLEDGTAMNGANVATVLVVE